MDILEARLGRADLEEALSASSKRETAKQPLKLNNRFSSLFCVLCASAVRLKTQTMLEGSIIQQLAIAHPAEKTPNFGVYKNSLIAPAMP